MTKPDPLKRTLRSTSDASWEDEFVPRSVLMAAEAKVDVEEDRRQHAEYDLAAAEAERDRLAARVAELEAKLHFYEDFRARVRP